MNKEKLSIIIGDIDESLVEESNEYINIGNHKTGIFKITLTAASICAVTFLLGLLFYLSRDNTPISENSGFVSENEITDESINDESSSEVINNYLPDNITATLESFAAVDVKDFLKVDEANKKHSYLRNHEYTYSELLDAEEITLPFINKITFYGDKLYMEIVIGYDQDYTISDDGGWYYEEALLKTWHEYNPENETLSEVTIPNFEELITFYMRINDQQGRFTIKNTAFSINNVKNGYYIYGNKNHLYTDHDNENEPENIDDETNIATNESEEFVENSEPNEIVPGFPDDGEGGIFMQDIYGNWVRFKSNKYDSKYWQTNEFGIYGFSMNTYIIYNNDGTLDFGTDNNHTGRLQLRYNNASGDDSLLYTLEKDYKRAQVKTANDKYILIHAENDNWTEPDELILFSIADGEKIVVLPEEISKEIFGFDLFVFNDDYLYMGKNDSQKVTFYKYNIITGDYNIISEENIILSLSQSLLQDLRGLINGKGDNDTSLLYFIEINDNGVNFKQIHSEKYTIIKPLHIEGDNYYYAVKSVEMNTEYSTVIYRYNAATETSEEVIKMSVIAENIFISDGYVYMLSDSSICYAKLD